MTRTEDPTLDLGRPLYTVAQLLVTPLRARWLHEACPGDPDVAAAVLALARAPRDVDRQRAVLGAIDRWQATDVRGARPSRHQLEDLCRYALRAGDELGDVSAYTTCTVALGSYEAAREPDLREQAAQATCLAAWNQRAARLRALGVRPLTGSLASECAS